MADISITAANCIAGANASIATGTAGTSITAGQCVYLASATKKWMLADADSATAEARKAGGIALNSASLNQPVSVATAGDVTIGGTMTAGTALYVSGTPGGICPASDVATGDYPCIVGMAKSTTVLAVNVQFPNVLI